MGEGRYSLDVGHPSSSIVVRPQDRVVPVCHHGGRVGLARRRANAIQSRGKGIILIMAIATVNPATGEVVKTFDSLTAAQIEAKLQRAAKAFEAQRQTPFAERATKMRRAAEILEKEKDECARLMTLEMGKPLKAAVAEAAKCATGCRYYAENAEKFLADEVVETGAKRSFVRYLPIGPMLAIMPWNFPFWQVFRFAAPALMAGNVGLLKHASNVPQCALKIEEIFSARRFCRRCVPDAADWVGRGRWDPRRSANCGGNSYGKRAGRHSGGG